MGNAIPLSPKHLTTGRLRYSVEKEIQKLNIDKTPLLKLLTQIGKKGVGRMEYHWLTKERRPTWGGIVSYGGSWGSGENAGGTITVTSGEGWMYAAQDIIKVPGTSDVNIYVVSVSTDTLTCTTFDNSTTIDFSSGVTGTLKLLSISNTFELGSNRGTEKSHQPTDNYNYIQIMQHPFSAVETLQHVEYDAGGQELSEMAAETLIEHEFAKERTLFFGQRNKEVSGFQNGVYEQYFTGGILERCTQNVSTQADLTQAEWGSWVNDAIYYSEKPVVFAGARIFEALSWWLKQGLQTTQSEKTLGIAVSNYLNEYGKNIVVIPHRELLQNDYAGYAFCLDLKDINYMYLNGEDTHLEERIETPGDKKIINEYRTWFGVRVGNPKRHGVLKGVVTISA